MLSSARIRSASGAVAVTAYEKGRHELYIAQTLNAPRQSGPIEPPPAILPAVTRQGGDVQQLLRDVDFGLPESDGEVMPYRARLSLDYVGQPAISAGLDPVGAFVGGGLTFAWGDMLGNHVMTTAVQTVTSFGGWSDVAQNMAGMVAYTNRTHRWDWSAAVQQVPYTSGGLSSGLDVVAGVPAVVEETVVVRQVARGVGGVAAYPFSRARRIEVTGGFQRFTFEQQVQTRAFSLLTGEVLVDRTTSGTVGQSMNLGSASVALVSDTSIFGATSPVAGGRYRLELTPTAGTIAYTGVLADYRRYLTPAPFYTLAGRILHYGRYGGNADDPRLPPLFIGYPQLVRGYDIGSFDAVECAGAAASCPAFDRLLGSRMLVASAEFRFPLLRPLGVRQGMYGPIPIEVAFFGDAGTAWTASETPTFFGGAASRSRAWGSHFVPICLASVWVRSTSRDRCSVRGRAG